MEERAAKTPAELVAEFRYNGPIALKNRQSLPWLVRKIPLSPGSLGLASVEYLVDTIYPRDQWMHRYDICAATRKEMVVTPAHDGRIVALVLRDIAKKLKSELAQRTIALHLVGAIQATYLFGHKTTPDCTVETDIFDFNLLASGRITTEEAAHRTAVSGDHATANWFLAHIEVPY